ncbi:hypothetical protein [Lactobacillus sp. B4026]|uniref:hypothetical protein n=1 Tax=Lactobacillus sp. B4026 TaxID=2818035 RepID=UPI00226BA232|nr:hypothetical protein [Lactobacillus sp. B4026]MCX8737268.1 hypothetical protein [Lactobacillus sp. B4026]
MTLSNIFFGKKVVQQAYLNNALIYQSKGWETLPSTCSEVWTKTYDNYMPTAIGKDSQDNIYVGAADFLYKIDTEGRVIWKTESLSFDKDSLSWDYYRIRSLLVSTDCIYCSVYGYQALNDIYKFNIAKVATDGTLIKSINLSAITSDTNDDWVFDMTKDASNMYFSTNSMLFKFDLNLNLLAKAYIPYAGFSVTTTDTSKYVFVGTRDNQYNSGYVYRYDKSDLGNRFKIPYNTGFWVTSIKLAFNDILYVGSVQKGFINTYDAESGKAIATINCNGFCSAICTDYQENVYFAFYHAVNSDRYTTYAKYSSDGTCIWDNLLIDTTNTSISVYYRPTQIITDSKGNIYITYYNTNSYLTIKKFINLVKEN